jgi:hypothetical protein
MFQEDFSKSHHQTSWALIEVFHFQHFCALDWFWDGHLGSTIILSKGWFLLEQLHIALCLFAVLGTIINFLCDQFKVSCEQSNAQCQGGCLRQRKISQQKDKAQNSL